MSWRGLRYKGVEFIYPSEWNAIVDALNDLANRIAAGKATFTGDGTTSTFTVSHNLGAEPLAVFAVKAAADLPDIDYVYADSSNIYVVFKSPPPSDSTVSFYWIAIGRLPGT